MAVNNNININLNWKDNASKSFNKVSKSSKGLWASLKKMWWPLKAVWIWLWAIAWVSILAWKEFVQMANDQIRVETQLDAVLKSTKNSAWLTADEIKNMASELQNVTTIWDETIIAGQNMLLTFTQIWKDVFPQATETLLDMATAMNNGMTPSAEQLSAQAIQLWKALNDPIVWVTALSRVWVKFTDDQKAMIKTLTESGDVMWAQKIILAELWTEFGGQARAQALTFEWQMQQLSNTLWDVKEEIWKGLIPIIMALVDEYKPVILEFANSIAVWFQNKENIDWMIESVKTWIWVLKTIWSVIWTIIDILWFFWWAIHKVWEDIWMFLAQTYLWFVELWRIIWEVWLGVKTATVSVFTSISEIVSGVITSITSKFTAMFDKIKAIANKIKALWGKISGAVSGAVSSVWEFTWLSWTKANWWDVASWGAYLVWERGAEVFTPTQSWTITPAGWAWAVTINMGWVTVTDEADENRLIEKMKSALTDDMKMFNNFGIS